MHTALYPLSAATHRISFTTSQLLSETLVNGGIPESVKNLAKTCFKSLSSVYLCSFGGSELTKGITSTPKETTKVQSITKASFSSSSTYLNMHGGLMTFSGIFSLIDALHEFGVINIGKLAGVLSTAGSVLFLGANILSLEENVRLYNELKATDWTETNIEEEELDWMKQSAFWGILSNMGYILATAAVLYSGATAMALLIAILSCFAGGIKIIYDLLLWAREQNICV